MSPSLPPAKKTIVVNPYKTNKKVAVPVASTAKSTMLFPKFAPALNVNPYKKKKKHLTFSFPLSKTREWLK
jgi:hypothetical protein